MIALKRKDNIVSRKSSENYYWICIKFFEKYRPPILLDSVINRNSWHAHPYQSISKLNFIHQMDSIITCGEDKFVKIWSRHGFLHCNINIV